jgi:Spy/CpxP family protein refolding chaperone
MTKMKLMLSLSFVLVFAAGGVLGVALDRSWDREGRRSRLARSLDLSRQQQERMRQIWSETLEKVREQMRARREDLRERRREQIRDLLTEEQQQRYDAIMQEYEDGQNQLREGRTALFEEARERTRRILNETQRRKYDELMEKRMKEWDRHRGRHQNREKDARGERTRPR